MNHQTGPLPDVNVHVHVYVIWPSKKKLANDARFDSSMELINAKKYRLHMKHTHNIRVSNLETIVRLLHIEDRLLNLS